MATTACNVLQWNLSIKDTLNKGHLSTQDSQFGPSGILDRVVLL